MSKANVKKYEVVVVTLKAVEKRSARKLQSFLLGRGFLQNDDHYYLPREGKLEVWQFYEITDVQLLLGGHEVYADKEDLLEEDVQWDELKVSYLLASLPRKYIDTYVNECSALETNFDLCMIHNGQVVTTNDVCVHANRLVDELEADMGAAGSETVATIMQMVYQGYIHWGD